MPFDFACIDWAERIVAGLTPIADLPLDEAAAEQAVGLFNNLRLPDVPGQPRLADVAPEWIRDLVRAIFGSVDDAGQRQVGEVFCMVPKKNGKTTCAAAIGIVFMLLNERPNADMLLIGSTQKISEIAFNQARDIIGADPYLTDRFHIQDNGNIRVINDRVTGSRLMIRTFAMDVLTGCKPIFVLLDEVHLLGSIPYAADVLRQIRGGLMPFPESLFFMITTQSDHQPDGVFKSELRYARGVRDGVIADGVRLLPVLYEFTEAVQTSKDQLWRDPKLWHLVTPSLNRPLTIERMIEGMKRAEHDGRLEVVAWATQHLNVQVGMALHNDRWIGADYWEAAARKGLTLAKILALSDVVTAGVDGGGLDDLYALAVFGRHAETKQWMGWFHAWCDPVVLERRKDIAAKLLDFEADGDLTICTYVTQDIVEIADQLQAIADMGLLPENDAIGLDRWSIMPLVDELAARGLTNDQMEPVRQGTALVPAIWGMERKLKDGTFVHCGQPLMDWVVGNAVAEQRGNAVLITKQTAGKAKIDPLIAGFNAGMLMQKNPQAVGAGISIPDGYRVA